MAVVMVGDNNPSQVYVKNKQKSCLEYGLGFTLIHLDDNTSQETLHNTIKKLNKDDTVTGIILQLPLPAHLDRLEALDLISNAKDVDGLGPTNSGRASLGLGKKTIYPATPLGIMRILDWIKFDAKGKDAVMIGRSNLVGRPTADMLGAREATVMVCHKETKDLKKFTKTADLIVVATGVPHLIGADHLKEGAVVIDVGISQSSESPKKIIGDVNTAACDGIASMITPVPGGVGPMTVASLLTNVIDAARLQVGMSKIIWDIPTFK
ncbi:MAG: methylenetetrahydrofolate dehydrogenase (NADP+)/methenyltetrahydrofolate cyclohydrolase [Alphaproteobacteria bacterium]|jgi:methylenetetrahydrofolate dehydrogenase (NADP+)/methenyltetrahydrofolate cyclohydrolase